MRKQTKIYIFTYVLNNETYNKPYAASTLERAMNKFKRDRRRRKENYSLVNIKVFRTNRGFIE